MKRLAYAFIIIGIIALSSGGLVTLAYAEGVWNDPNGQLNSPFTVICSSGILADREVGLKPDGEYNWMFAKGQTVNIVLQLNPSFNSSVQIFFFGWSYGNLQNGTLHLTTDVINWTLTIPQAGHWQLEMRDYSGIGTFVQVKVYANSSGSFGLLDCLNPGDLFRRDRGD